MITAGRIGAYLERLGFGAPPPPTIEGLRGLHAAHLERVPFENLDIHLGEKLLLEPEAPVAKIVERRRGGFCYELNGAFSTLLQALGFDVVLLAARVHDAKRARPAVRPHVPSGRPGGALARRRGLR